MVDSRWDSEIGFHNFLKGLYNSNLKSNLINLCLQIMRLSFSFYTLLRDLLMKNLDEN